MRAAGNTASWRMVLPPCLLAQICVYVKYSDKSLIYSIIYLLLTQYSYFYLYWWQHGGGGGCSGKACLHCTADALPTTANALPPPPPLHCPHFPPLCYCQRCRATATRRNTAKLATTATLPPPPPLTPPPPRCYRRCRCRHRTATALPLPLPRCHCSSRAATATAALPPCCLPQLCCSCRCHSRCRAAAANLALPMPLPRCLP